MFRDDGSFRSVNTPVWDNRYQIRDYGLYRGVIRDVIYIDNEFNDSGDGTPNEVLYDIMLIGGDRDGQMFSNARLMRNLGGFSNYEEVVLKKVGGITGLDPSSILALTDPSIAEMSKLNGDSVYIQFLNGDITMPVIVGMAYHQAATPEASEEDGQRYRHKFNGISTEIDKDGVFTWTKDNGANVPFAPNSENPLYPFVNQFAPLPSQEQAVKITLDNKYSFKFEYPLLGLNFSINGLTDEFSFQTTTGTSVNLTGLISDSFSASTALGTSLDVKGGISDSISLTAATGASVSIDGLTDQIILKSALGDQLSISAISGIQASTPSGTSLAMVNGLVTLSSAGQGFLVLGPTGFIGLGNASGDVLRDILGELIKSLSTATYSGFGAPGSNVAELVQLAIKLKLITG